MNIVTKNKKGFTLIELIVVIAVISMIAAVVMSNLSNARSRTRNAARLTTADQIAKALQIATTGAVANQFPTSGTGWRCLGKASCWSGVPITQLPSLNTVVNAGIGGGSVPADLFWTSSSQMGDTFVYNSSVNPTGGEGLGAYLAWVMENQAGSSCGRGFVFAPSVNGGAGYECMLYLGPPTP